MIFLFLLYVRVNSAQTMNIFCVTCNTKCKEGHSVFHLIVAKLFNTFSCNMLKSLNAPLGCKRDSLKIRTLQSRSTNQN